MHEVAPRAVRIADAIEAISCTMNLAVSFFVMVFLFSYGLYGLYGFFVLSHMLCDCN